MLASLAVFDLLVSRGASGWTIRALADARAVAARTASSTATSSARRARTAASTDRTDNLRRGTSRASWICAADRSCSHLKI